MKYRILALLFLSIISSWMIAQTNSNMSLQQRIRNKETAALNGSFSNLNRINNVNSLPEQDCNAAIIVCQPTFSVSNSYIGVGTTNEIINNSCLGSGEKNSVWYTFTTNSAGTVEFLVTPNSLGDDYDFALYDITNQSCSDINNGILTPIRCNFSATSGMTGLSSAGTNPSEPASGSNYSTILNTQVSKTYVLVLSNYSSSAFGYFLDFSASTAGIYTGTTSALQQVTTYCDSDSLILNMSRPIINNSIASDGSDFSLSGSGGPYTIISAEGMSNSNSSQIKIKFSPVLSGSGPWNLGVLVGGDNNTLLESCSTQSTAVSSITFSAPPNNIVLGPTSVCKGASFTLTAGPATTYTWSGNIVPVSQINQQVISVNTNSAGVFSFSVQSNGACGLISSTKTVTILDFPTANFSVLSANSICAGTAVSFSNTSIFPCSINGSGTNVCNCGAFLCSPTPNQNGYANYVWDYGDTTAQMSGYNPNHSYLNSGSYVVRLNASNMVVNPGCVSTATLIVNVLPLPIVSVASGTICNGSNFVFLATGSTTYTWSTGATTQSIVVTPSISTIYTVTGSNACGVNSQTVNILVNSLPAISVNSGTICSGNSFTITPSGAVSYTYSGGSDIVNPTTSSSYTVSGEDALGCVGSNVSNVTVNLNPTITVNSGAICSGQSFTIIPNGASTYTFSGGLDIISPTADASYSVSGTDANGCIGNAVSSITVYILPTLTITGTNTVCLGSSATLTVASIGGTIYNWSTGAFFPIANVTPTINTTYTVTVIDFNGCSNSETVSVTVDNSCQDVWPGDANSDGVADNLDVLELGLHYTQTGSPRASTNNNWQSYFAANWTGNITNGANLNHSDCNGDGIINDDDTLAIYNNYSLMHTFKPAQTNTFTAHINIVPDQPTVVKGMWGTASVYLGDATTPANDINGVAFTVDFDNTLIEPNSIYIEYQNSFLDASQNLHFRKLDFAIGKIFTATTHTVNNNVNGFGKIATLHYQILSSLTTDQVLNISLSQANKSEISGLITPLSSGAGTLMAVGSSVGIKETLNSGNVSISPNPTTGVLNITFSTIPQSTKIDVYNSIGALVLTETLNNKHNIINTSQLSNGMYLVKLLENNRITTVQKIVKQ